MEQEYKILVVEDSELLRAVVTDALKGARFTVLEAVNGKEGLDAAKSEHPDLILLDLMMPVMDGLEMFKQLREDAWGKTVPVIMLSAADEKKITSWVNGEEMEYLMKGNWTMDEVVARVKAKLGIE